MEKKMAISMFGQKRLSREGGIEIVVKELCTRMVQSGCIVAPTNVWTKKDSFKRRRSFYCITT